MADFRITGALEEARRRNVFRDVGLYVVGAWALLQVAEIAFPALDIPERSLRYVWVGVLVLFPISIFFGWRYEIAAGRIVRTRVAGEQVGQPLQRSDQLILTALLGVAAAVSIGLVVEITASREPFVETVALENIDPASIAVLPFVNMSPDPDNDYLADGIAEELLNGLSHVPELRVTARTSAFAFKGQAVDIRTIAQKLGVAHVLEGSVRSSGDKLRITAQLIDSQDGTHEWSETYERNLQDVFAIQDDITKNVVAALSATIRVPIEQAVQSGSTDNLEAYTHFLRGAALIRERYERPDEAAFEAITEFQAAIDLDPQFGDAYAVLADAYYRAAETYRNRASDIDKEREMYELFRSTVEKALSVSPDSPASLLLTAKLFSDSKEQEEALLRRVIQIDPSNAEAMIDLAWRVMDEDPYEALELGRMAMELDPLNHRAAFTLAEPLWRTGRLKEAAEVWVLAAELQPGSLLAFHPQDRRNPLEELEALADVPINLNFEQGTDGWVVNEICQQEAVLSTVSLPKLGGHAGVLSSTKVSGYSTAWTDRQCNIYQDFLARPYRGRYIRFAGNLKKSDGANAILKIRMHGEDDVVNYQDTAGEPLEAGSSWRHRQLALYVPEQAVLINISVNLFADDGGGEIWIDGLTLEVADNPEFENAIRIGEYD